MELYEASYYGLLERIPVLLTTVNVDAVNAVSMSDFPISEAVQWFIHYYNTYNSSTRNKYAQNLCLAFVFKLGKQKLYVSELFT